MLVAGLLTAVVLEAVLRTDLVWRPVALTVAVATVLALLWRRTQPLAVVAAVFGVLIVTDVAVLVSGSGSFGLYTMICVILLPYSLVRWGSGREIIIGLAIILLALVLGNIADFTGYGEAAIGSMFLLFPGTLGAAVRYRWTARAHELDQVRLREREQLARELHDTVAHHVSAIVIRAQAGRAVAETRPAAAIDALAIIEAEGTRTLAEMRTMVGVLREDGTAALAPQPGVADLDGLARSVGDRPRVEVDVAGDLEDLGPAVDAAIYRIAQESVTNAVRHARQATRIDVRVTSYDDSVRLTVRDDGEAVSAPRNSSGYGLVGMTERAMLLGGSFSAGPGSDRGWTVDVVLPRTAVGR